MRVHCIQHVPFETPGAILAWARDRNHTMSCTLTRDSGVFPATGEYDLLLVMGGPMSVGDEREYPWLVAEKRCIGDAVADNRGVLGICLGAQLLAEVLGARVYRNAWKEIGWFPVRRVSGAYDSPVFGCFPDVFTPFHWHGDVFDLPSGAVRLAESDATVNQAFGYGGRVFGLQFHPEMNESGVRNLLENCGEDMVPGPYVQNAGEIESGLEHLPVLTEITWQFMDRLERSIRSE